MQRPESKEERSNNIEHTQIVESREQAVEGSEQRAESREGRRAVYAPWSLRP
jgi:hypothetical protein